MTWSGTFIVRPLRMARSFLARHTGVDVERGV